jgi:hypothetical protein
MQKNDILIKKWCFGIGRSKVREEMVQNNKGEAEVVRTYPKYRTIALKVLSAKKKKGSVWEVEVERYSSVTAKPKKVKLLLVEKKYKRDDKTFSTFAAPNDKRPYLRVSNMKVTDKDMPPIGSLITIDKKHAIVTDVGRNQLTVWINNRYKTITVRPGTVRWHSDKILENVIN